MAYEKLMEKIMELYPKAERAVEYSMINVRTSYPRELEKVKDSNIGTEVAYVPNLWYFKEIYFLRFSVLNISQENNKILQRFSKDVHVCSEMRLHTHVHIFVAQFLSTSMRPFSSLYNVRKQYRVIFKI